MPTFLDRFLGRETKAAPATTALVSMLGGQEPFYSSVSYRNLSEFAFARNVYVYRGITGIASAAASIPWKARRGKEVLETHKGLDRMRRPNPEQGFSEWLESLIAYWLLAGNSYGYAVRGNSAEGEGAGKPVELWTLRPDRITIKPDNKKRIAGFIYRVDPSDPEGDFLRRQDVMHLKLFAARDDWYGLSPIKVAARAIDQHNAANDANTALLQNFMRTPGFLIAKGMLTDDDVKDLRREVRENFSGPKNSGRPTVLHGDMSFTPTGFSPVDMDFARGSEQAAIQILVALGYPPELAGIASQKTYANVSEARVGLMEETVLPMMDKLQAHINIWLPPMYGDDVEFFCDKDAIEVLQEDRDKKRTFILSAFDKGLLDVDTACTELGFEPVGGDIGKLRIMPGTVKRIEDIIEPPQPPPSPLGGPGGLPGKPGAGGAGGNGKPPAKNPGPTNKAPGKDVASGEKKDWPFPDYLDFAEALIDEAVKYSPLQLRDAHGRWTAGLVGHVGDLSMFTPESQAKMVKALAAYGLTPEDLQANVGKALDDAKANMRPEDYEAAKNWYSHAHEVTGELATAFGMEPERVAAMTAAMSPRNPWDDKANGNHEQFPNIHDTTALLYLHDRNPSVHFGANEDRIVRTFFPKDDTSALMNRDIAWNDLPPNAAAALFKASGRGHGTFGEVAVVHGPNAAGTTTMPRNISKAIAIQNGADIDKTLGGHKVRSFYNNIVQPEAAGPVTVDTWQVQCAAIGGKGPQQRGDHSGMLFEPEKLLAAGGVGVTTAGSHIKAVGTYPLIADATAKAGAERGLLPLQAQAISWTYFRSVEAPLARQDAVVQAAVTRSMASGE